MDKNVVLDRRKKPFLRMKQKHWRYIYMIEILLGKNPGLCFFSSREKLFFIRDTEQVKIIQGKCLFSREQDFFFVSLKLYFSQLK